MLSPPCLILHLTSSSVLGYNARIAIINSPENCSITCHYNDSNASVCVSFLFSGDDAYWLEKKGTCNKAPLKLSSQCVRAAAGNLVITSKSIFTFSLSSLSWRVGLSLAQSIWQRSFPAFGCKKGGVRNGSPVLGNIDWGIFIPTYLFSGMENIEIWLHGNCNEMWIQVMYTIIALTVASVICLADTADLLGFVLEFCLWTASPCLLLFWTTVFPGFQISHIPKDVTGDIPKLAELR